MTHTNPKTPPRDIHPERRQDPKGPAVEFPKNPVEPEDPEDHEGATEEEVGDRTGPGAGYDDEPEKADDKGGVG